MSKLLTAVALAIATALALPVAGGEQEYSLHGFRWLIANDAVKIVQPDHYYFGGFIRCTQVARMAAAFGKAFKDSRYVSVVYLVLPVIGLLERGGQLERPPVEVGVGVAVARVVPCDGDYFSAATDALRVFHDGSD